jgi:hypothetical protein
MESNGNANKNMVRRLMFLYLPALSLNFQHILILSGSPQALKF